MPPSWHAARATGIGHRRAVSQLWVPRWTYDTIGTLTAVPDPRDWGAPDRLCRSLVPLRCELFGNWIFVCKADDGPSLEHFLNPVAQYFRHLPLPDLRLVHQRSVEIRGNYKIVLENFLEAYHFRLLHRQTTDRIFDNTGPSIHLWKHRHSLILYPEPPPGLSRPGHRRHAGDSRGNDHRA